jgi:hypothetical protein
MTAAEFTLDTAALDLPSITTVCVTSPGSVVSIHGTGSPPDDRPEPIPCKSVQEAIQKARAGETVWIGTGLDSKILRTEREVGPPCPVCGSVDPRLHDENYHARRRG